MTHDAERLVQIAQGKLAQHGRAPLSAAEELELRQKAAEFNRIPSREEVLGEAHIQWLREFATPDAKRWDRRTYLSPPPPVSAPKSSVPPAVAQVPGHLPPSRPDAVSDGCAAGPASGGPSCTETGFAPGSCAAPGFVPGAAREGLLL